jgi:hypothetical protein
MPDFKTHCEDCEMILGKPYEFVHQWLDVMNSIFPFQIFSDYHRSFRHNSYGIAYLESVSYKHGLAGRIHIIKDYCAMYTEESFLIKDDFMLFHEKLKNASDIMKYSNKALMYFNNLKNFDVQIPHLFVDNEGLVSKGMKND